jgi:hypothetical protein
MHRVAPLETLLALTVVLAACDQNTQRLPFEADLDATTKISIGLAGGLISHPGGISIDFPAGALARAHQISVSVGSNPEDFPGSPEGTLIPGTFFRVAPAALVLKLPVSVDVSLLTDSLNAEDLLRLGFAIESVGSGVVSQGVSIDLTSGILRGTLHGLGAISAIVAADALRVVPETPPVLTGGFFLPGLASRPSGAATPARTDSGTPYAVRCGPAEGLTRCSESGAIVLWASTEIQERLAADMVLVNPDVDGSLEFTDFVDGVPTKVTGTLDVQGTLRVQLGQSVTSFEIDDVFTTNGPDGSSTLTVEGASITFHQTSGGQRTVEYGLPDADGGRLIVRGERTVEFGNSDGSTTSATLFIDLTLTR